MDILRWGRRALGLMLAVILTTGCDQVKDQIAKDTARPDQPSFEGLDVRLYMDQSGSTTTERAPIAALLKATLETHPDYIRVHRAYFGQTVKPESQKLTSGQDLDEIGREWQKVPAKEPSRTYFASIFDDASADLGRHPETKQIVVIGTDGGFEDPDAARAAARRLARSANLAMVVFAGVKTQNSDKRSRLGTLIDAMKRENKALDARIIGIDSAVEVADVRKGISQWIAKIKPTAGS
jgi:hypothetical protein